MFDVVVVAVFVIVDDNENDLMFMSSTAEVETDADTLSDIAELDMLHVVAGAAHADEANEDNVEAVAELL